MKPHSLFLKHANALPMKTRLAQIRQLVQAAKQEAEELLQMCQDTGAEAKIDRAFEIDRGSIQSTTTWPNSIRRWREKAATGSADASVGAAGGAQAVHLPTPVVRLRAT
jgi:hypothetical protein